MGQMKTDAKSFEARLAVEEGAHEIDMVINVGLVLANTAEADALCVTDISNVVAASQPAPVKVIIETCLLPDDDAKERACRLAMRGGAAFVKTSTGFAADGRGRKGGATVHDVALMRRVVGSAMGVKASGGIRTYEDADAMFAAGADRIGCSASVAIVRAARESELAALRCVDPRAADMRMSSDEHDIKQEQDY